MGEFIKSEDVVLLFDSYSEDSKKLHESFKLAGKAYTAVAIDDDGFLPDDVMSVYGYFLGEFKTGSNVPGRPRYFNQINVPEYWEISGTNTGGKVHELNKERGRIFYTQPSHKRLVRIVDWYDDNGVVRSSDHYNRYGALYARTIFNSKGQKVNKSYFSATGVEIIVENYVTKDIILNDGDVVRIFHSKTEFVIYFMEITGLSGKRIFFNTLSTSFFVSQGLAATGRQDVLFWQEPVNNEIPGNMCIILEGNANRTIRIMVQKKASYKKLLELGAPADIIRLLGFIYPFKKENNHKPQVLICTNSDRIAQCQQLVEALPEMHFNIAALTEMSSKLMSMDKYSNVSLYPGISHDILDELFAECDYYLDINHETEIVSAVENAFLHNHLIYAFRETLHNANYVAEENIYSIADVEKLIDELKNVISDKELMKEKLEKQHIFAMMEHTETYSQL